MVKCLEVMLLHTVTFYSRDKILRITGNVTIGEMMTDLGSVASSWSAHIESVDESLGLF